MHSHWLMQRKTSASPSSLLDNILEGIDIRISLHEKRDLYYVQEYDRQRTLSMLKTYCVLTHELRQPLALVLGAEGQPEQRLVAVADAAASAWQVCFERPRQRLRSSRTGTPKLVVYALGGLDDEADTLHATGSCLTDPAIAQVPPESVTTSPALPSMTSWCRASIAAKR